MLGQQCREGDEVEGRDQPALPHEGEHVVEAPVRDGESGVDEQDSHQGSGCGRASGRTARSPGTVRFSVPCEDDVR